MDNEEGCAETSSEWGRVDDDGTVYVKTNDGERAVGSYPAGTPEEALHFFTERFAALAFEVQLLEQRVNGAKLPPEEAAESIKTVRAQVSEANAVGDLASLNGRLDALAPVLAVQREAAVALVDPVPPRRTWLAPFAAGGAATLALVAAVKKKDR